MKGKTMNARDLNELTPFLVSYSLKKIQGKMDARTERSYSDYYSDDHTEVILNLKQKTKLTPMEMTMSFLPAFSEEGWFRITALESSAMFTYKLCSEIMSAEALGKEEVNLTELFKEYKVWKQILGTGVFCATKIRMAKTENREPSLTYRFKSINENCYIELKFV